MTIFISIVAFILLALIIIAVHELGHFWIAKRNGISVTIVSIGLGKAIFSRYGKEGTQYKIGAIPLGGYVKMLDERESTVAALQLHLSYPRQPIFTRFKVILAGPIFNLLFSVLAFSIFFSVGQVTTLPIIGEIVTDSAAANAGVQSGEQVIAIDGVLTEHWRHILYRLINRLGDKGSLALITLEPETGLKKQYTLSLENFVIDPLKPNVLTSLGIHALKSSNEKYSIIERTPLWMSPIKAVQEVYLFSYLNVNIIYKLITGDISIKSLAGPLSLFKSSGNSMAAGWLNYVMLLAFISISIAILNLLPIPGLDGAQIAYLLYEKLSGNVISLAVQVLAYKLGAILILLLLVQVTVYDIQRFLT